MIKMEILILVFGLGSSVLMEELSSYLCLQGTLAPELGLLTHLKSITLRNNSFYGNVPKEIGELKELEVLDLGYNNLSGPFPSELANNLSLTTLLLDNNEFLGSISPDLYELKTLSEIQADENQLRASCSRKECTWNMGQAGDMAHRMLLQVRNRPKANRHRHKVPPAAPPFLGPSFPPSESPSSSFSPVPSPSESPLFSPVESPSSLPLPPFPSPVGAPTQAAPAPAPAAIIVLAPREHNVIPMTPPASSPSEAVNNHSKHHMIVVAGIVGGSVFLLISIAAAFVFRSSKVVAVKPWATGLSGQLQKAFVTGVPKLKRAELEAACEDFSNIIGSFSDGTVYKGTLSSGVEIAVTSTEVKSSKEWSKNLEEQFRKKIATLSKMNHKNFVNLIGYCEEEAPFTRMMVFEYAPNGTLFEHLHIKEAEHLDWKTRLRIAMGIAYCLEYMHELTPPVIHENLKSSSIHLTEDYAAKISDFTLWNNVTAPKKETESADPNSADAESNIYSFGLILYEMITGRILYAMDKDSLVNWTSEMVVDPTLKHYKDYELEKLLSVILSCIQPDAKRRPKMSEVVAELKQITAMEPDGATPKLSPLWWAELEIMSTEGI
ncbi:probable inactive receptor-like protein kinase At3g56050 isoform X2 [Euphorbia lathyris]|uniref:probable inactive receptor-like protein kinase At3g56050 isoform X2 n=1 Tax=Euphorbia lathyris TaxID=212925 RepID=UPI003313A89D